MSEPQYISGMSLYCRFRGAGMILRLKLGPRGGVYAFHEGKWKYARKTRSKKPQ